MTYNPNLSAAARRHIEAADALYTGARRDVAGYLYGIAAECAIKAMMIEVGLRPSNRSKDDPFWAHFPELRTLLRDSLSRRNTTTLRCFVENDNFFSQWDIAMRYCKGNEIQEKWIAQWKAQAREVVDSIGT
jgi:hypothetical protein